MDSILVSRLESVADKMENILLKYERKEPVEPSATNISEKNSKTPKLVELLDDSIGDKLENFYNLSGEIGGEIGIIGEMAKNTFQAHRNFVWTACGREKPNHAEFANLVRDLSTKMGEITEFKEKSDRKSKSFDNLCALEAAICGLGWVAEQKTPASVVKDATETSHFYINRILVAHKGKNDQHSEWAKHLKEILSELHTYVKKNHTTGLIWNSEPGAAPEKNNTATNRKNVPAPPPPPPPPPPVLSSSKDVSHQSGVAALLESLNTGLSATSRLKKVTADMQTHKNASLRLQPVLPKETNKISSHSAVELLKNSTPCILWDGKIWKVDFQIGNKEAVVEVTDKKESIYIYKCTDSVIKINGKANAITLDSCKRTSVVFDGLVAQCEIINSQSIQIQTLGELPTVSIQKTDGCHIFLSREACSAQIIASKSSEMNVSAQLNEQDDEYTEMALPEQFMTQIIGKKLVTVTSEVV